MPQDRNTGAEANAFGKRMALIVANDIGAQKCHSKGNEFSWQGKQITIRSAHRGNSYVGALYSMLDRVDAVLAALETTVRDQFQVWEIDTQSFLAHSKPQAKNPDIAQVPTKVFSQDGKLITKVRDKT